MLNHLRGLKLRDLLLVFSFQSKPFFLLNRYALLIMSLQTHHQCDKIGQFLKVFRYKVSNKVAQILCVNSWVTTFWSMFETFGFFYSSIWSHYQRSIITFCLFSLHPNHGPLYEWNAVAHILKIQMTPSINYYSLQYNN